VFHKTVVIRGKSLNPQLLRHHFYGAFKSVVRKGKNDSSDQIYLLLKK
jgi:hypothetical protein